MRLISFTVRGSPVPKQSFVYGRGHGYPKKNVKEWQEWVAFSAVANYKGEVLECKLSVQLDFYLKRDIADIDNLAKCVLDGLQGIVFKNDKQIVRMELTKNISDTPGVAVRIREHKDGHNRSRVVHEHGGGLQGNSHGGGL